MAGLEYNEAQDYKGMTVAAIRHRITFHNVYKTEALATAKRWAMERGYVNLAAKLAKIIEQ